MMNKIESVIREAGLLLLYAHPTKRDIHQKQGLANFVTDYDVKIQKYLMAEFSAIIPDAAFYGEEDADGNRKNVSDGYTFFIDPIDGTTNFMFDYQNSCVSVGLAEAGKIIAGWVYNPYMDQMWSAVKGGGAYLNNRQLKIWNKGLANGICAFGCARYNEGDGIFDILPELFSRSLSIRNGGSAAIDLCRIASGSNVGYIEMLLQPYDYAAAGLIIEEAGGVIEQTDGSPVTLDRGCSIIAGTLKAVKEIRKLIKK